LAVQLQSLALKLPSERGTVHREEGRAALFPTYAEVQQHWERSTDVKSHWESVYGTKASDAVSWYAPHLQQSLGYFVRPGLRPDAAIIDAGGGEATLVDDLLVFCRLEQ
jgi:hypothetical protein